MATASLLRLFFFPNIDLKYDSAVILVVREAKNILSFCRDIFLFATFCVSRCFTQAELATFIGTHGLQLGRNSVT